MSVVRKLVVFHTPPLAPATYTVFPLGSDGSTAVAVTRPVLAPSFADAGPTGVQASRVSSFVGSVVNTRKPAWNRSATRSPSPLVGTARGRVRVKLLIWATGP